jgi:hypothetical protein
MSDDLVKRLANARCEGLDELCWAAADRIAELEAKLGKAVEGLESMQKVPRSDASHGIMMVMISYILAELKGDKDD